LPSGWGRAVTATALVDDTKREMAAPMRR